MVRRTSAIAYESIKASGALSERRWEAYDVMFRHGPVTGQEMDFYGKRPGLWKRASELKDMEVAIEVGLKECSVTGEMALAWDVTEKMPIPYGRKDTSAQTIARLQEKIDNLHGLAIEQEQEIERLREALNGTCATCRTGIETRGT